VRRCKPNISPNEGFFRQLMVRTVSDHDYFPRASHLHAAEAADVTFGAGAGSYHPAQCISDRLCVAAVHDTNRHRGLSAQTSEHARV
jgi:hypothetical protein